ncbi:MAG: sigma-70 region 2 domain protein [Nocardia sp.]|uniref:RNA polymerase sigma factor n=1 Tax=Nocardia sp. TaxID=1821 RepID=UPI00260DB0C2|nr:RNA polymerase sigma factor [Nocardia sp.]MCU1640151.1 sigma-70 region 2 domain protein [Nocardia sp.]
MNAEVDAAVAEAFRSERGHIVATLIRVTGDWELAEEAAQEAFATALQVWPRAGVPRKPGAWLTTTARNHAIDRVRRNTVGGAKLRELAVLTPPSDAGLFDAEEIRDDRLRLIFTCCHPALAFESQIALTLRTLAGLSTAQIARAFLMPEQTLSKRLVRARAKIKNAGIPYRVPPAHLLPERTTAVLGVLYLIFNEGYSATIGADMIRESLSAEAIRLQRLLVELMPDEPEAQGLLALMLLHDARRTTRVNDAGALVSLEFQDRSKWDRGRIAEGTTILDSAMPRGPVGPYRVQAAIAACHVTAPTAAETDWAQIAGLYDHLVGLVPSPIVRLNRVVAIAMADGPDVGLALLADLEAEKALAENHLLPATRADLLRRLGRSEEAAASYRRALDLVATDAERRYLTLRLEELSQ